MNLSADEIQMGQILVCRRYGARFCPADLSELVGISHNFDSASLPLNGLRHPPEGKTCGWYLWAGDLSTADDFFRPMHLSHLRETHPQIFDYLGLPPGWRFLIAGDHVDAWFDEKLLDI